MTEIDADTPLICDNCGATVPAGMASVHSEWHDSLLEQFNRCLRTTQTANPDRTQI